MCYNPLRTAALLVGRITEGFSTRLGESGNDTSSGIDESTTDSREDPPRRMTVEEFLRGKYDDESESSEGG